jgi:hypothetical protein
MSVFHKKSITRLVVVLFLMSFITTGINTIITPHSTDDFSAPLYPGRGLLASAATNFTFGGAYPDEGNGVWSDGIYVYTCGVLATSMGGDADLLLVKWSQDGDQVWNRTWDGGSYDVAFDVQGDGAGYIYTCGNTNNTGSGSTDMVLIKWSTAGNRIWNRTFDGGGYDECKGIWCNTTSVYTAGYTAYTAGEYDSDAILLRWNTVNGNVIWNQTLGGTKRQAFNDVWSDDVRLYACGYEVNTSTFSYDLLLATYETYGTTGNFLWSRTFDADRETVGCSVWGDGLNIYTCGYNENPCVGAELFLVKWDFWGLNVVWSRTWGDYDMSWSGASAVWGDIQGNLYTCGHTNIYGAGGWEPYDILITQWNSDGDFLWNTTIGSADYDMGWGIWADNTAIYACGTSCNGVYRDMILIKIGAPVLSNLTINPLGNITYVVSQRGNNISWTMYDSNSSTRVCGVYRDGISILNCSWAPGIPVTCWVNCSLAGVYNYTIIATDGLGEWVRDDVFVTIVENVVPTITAPEDLTVIVGTWGSISWNITDTTTGDCNYTLYRNGVAIASGYWTSGVPIIVVLGELPEGDYNFTIVISDGLGGSTSDTIIVQVSSTHGDPMNYTLIFVLIIVVVGGILVSILVRARVKSKAGGSQARKETLATKQRDSAERKMQKEIPMYPDVQKEIPLQPSVQKVMPKQPAVNQQQASPSTQAQGRSTPSFCPKCGNPVPKGAEQGKFCVYCGESLGT